MSQKERDYKHVYEERVSTPVCSKRDIYYQIKSFDNASV